MRKYGGVESELRVFLISALQRDECLGSRPCHYTPEETIPRNHCIGGWVGLTAGVYVTENRKHVLPMLGIETRLLCSPVRSLVPIPV
jgi:hypothetical protein